MTVVWTRLCGCRSAVTVKHLRKGSPFRAPLNFDENMSVSLMDGAVCGSDGEVRITIKNQKQETGSGWIRVDKDRDYTVKVPLYGLKPSTEYTVKVDGRKSKKSPVTTVSGSVKTAPAAGDEKPILFTVSSDQYFWDFDDSISGFKIYHSMQAIKPDFFVHQGDYVYYDKEGPVANNIVKARHQWNAQNSWLSLRTFSSSVPVYHQKDDHDMLRDDAYPGISRLGDLAYSDALSVWYEQVPVTGKPYRTFRWGKTLQIWLMEGREFRSENTKPDDSTKTIWGKEQIDWLISTVSSSDASFKIIFSSSPIVGPDRDKGKNDNYANKAFETEGRKIREWLSKQKNLVVINGDRHWQYASVDDETGLMEFGHGPASDSHAQGWDPTDIRSEHRFLRVKGGFLSGKIVKEDGNPTLIITLHDVDGNIVYSYTLKE